MMAQDSGLRGLAQVTPRSCVLGGAGGQELLPHVVHVGMATSRDGFGHTLSCSSINL